MVMLIFGESVYVFLYCHLFVVWNSAQSQIDEPNFIGFYELIEVV